MMWVIAITFTVYAACVIAGDADRMEEKMWKEKKKHSSKKTGDF